MVKTQGIWVALWSVGLAVLIGALFLVLNVFNFSQDYAGFSYVDFIYLGSLLVVLGVSFGLPSTNGSEREFLFRLSPIWILMVLIGASFDLLSIVELFSVGEWEKWFFLAVPFLSFGLIFFFGSMKDETRERFSSLWLIYLLLAIIGLVIGLLAIAGIFDLMGTDPSYFIGSARWDHYPVYALLPLAFGLIPLAFVMSARENTRNLLGKLGIIWLITALVSVIIYAVSALQILTETTIIDVSGTGTESLLVIALPFGLFGFILYFACSGDRTKGIVKPLAPVWIILSLAGIAIFLLSTLLEDTFPTSTYGLGFVVIAFGGGLSYKALSYDFVPSLPMRAGLRTIQAAGKQGSFSESELLQKATVDESTVYLNIEKKSLENALTQLQNAFRSGRVSQAFFNTVSSHHQSRISGIDAQIVNLKDSSKRSTRKSIFEEELGIKKSESAKAKPSAPAPQAAPKPQQTSPAPAPKPAQAAPPSGPPSPPMPSGPPAPPGMPSVSPSGPPTPPGMPSAGLPRPSGPPTPPGMPSASPSSPSPLTPSGPPAPPGMPSAGPPRPSGPPAPGAPGPDVVGSARSTSIAELRGEMLKELRRLRDIFKEE